MIGLNGGLIGSRRTTSTTTGSGMWEPKEQVLLKRANLWPRTDDPYAANVSLLLHMDGSNGSTTFTDSSGNATSVTANGNAQISTADGKFGGASGYFDGSGDYLTIPSSTLFDFGSGDMTIEFWFKTTQSTSNTTLLTREWGAGNTGGWSIQLNGNSSGPLTIYWADWSTSSVFMAATGSAHRDGNWHHFAWTKEGSSHVMWFDGASVATATTSTAFASVSKNLTLGNDLTFGSGSRAYLGYIDELRITKGVARYTTSFTPQATAFPNP